MRHVLRAIAFCCPLLPSTAPAHEPSDSFLSFDVGAAAVTARWDIAVRDLDQAIGLDANGDGEITWGELRARHADVEALALSHLEVSADGVVCGLHATDHLVDQHSGRSYAVLRLAVRCPAPPRELLDLRYDLLFELDATHRGLARVSTGEHDQAGIFSQHRRTWSVSLERPAPWQPFGGFFRDGAIHIWQGFDHLLFLVTLLLVAPLRWLPNASARGLDRFAGWQPTTRLRDALMGLLRVVTAFTLAHSITLSLAALRIVELPSRWVESAIAASVLLAALNNLHPLVRRRLWLVAFVFGLVHGLGFASVLLGLDLPAGALITALLGFNLGVEAGQAAVALAVVPIVFALRGTRAYLRFAVPGCSLAIAAIAALLLFQRLGGVG